ncbi:MAG: RICIN domain-containing protein [Streptosporangiaceae bacterium]
MRLRHRRARSGLQRQFGQWHGQQLPQRRGRQCPRYRGPAGLDGNLQYSGYYTFTADNSGLCIDAPSTSSGVQLEQYTCNGTPSQAFSLAP